MEYDDEADSVSESTADPAPVVISKKNRSARTGLQFPAGVMAYKWKNWRNPPNRVRVDVISPIYMTAAIEYLVTEVLELSGNRAKKRRNGVIRPRHIRYVMEQDKELKQLVASLTEFRASLEYSAQDMDALFPKFQDLSLTG